MFNFLFECVQKTLTSAIMSDERGSLHKLATGFEYTLKALVIKVYV